MADDLRAPLPRAFERLADDLVVGRHGDPHVAFAVLVYPDREPAIIAITGAGSGVHDLSKIVTSDDKDANRKPGRFFTIDDLRDAQHALSDAVSAMRGFGWRRKEDETAQLGEYIASEIRRIWEHRRMASIDRALEQATREARYGSKCEICGSGFTERGLKMHQARSRWCSARLAERAMDTKEAPDA